MSDFEPIDDPIDAALLLSCTVPELNDPDPDPNAGPSTDPDPDPEPNPNPNPDLGAVIEDEEGAKKLPNLVVVSFAFNEKALALLDDELKVLSTGASPLKPANGFPESLGFGALDKDEVRSTLPNIEGFAGADTPLDLLAVFMIFLFAICSAVAR